MQEEVYIRPRGAPIRPSVKVRDLTYERHPDFNSIEEEGLFEAYTYYADKLEWALDTGAIEKYNHYCSWKEEIKTITKQRGIYHKLVDYQYNKAQDKKLRAFRGLQ